MKSKTQQILIVKVVKALSLQLILPCFGLFAAASQALAQAGPPQLPVYSVTQSGATATQARSLADSLGIPPNAYNVSNGMITYLNPIFLDVPSTTVTDPSGGSNLVNQTVNKYPAIPIRLEQVDIAALNNRTVLGSNAAVSLANAALANAGLTPASGTPIVTHTFLTAFFTNDAGGVISGSNYLDTHVSYQMTLSGVPLIGPGAQVQISYGSNNHPTRVLYSNRQLSPGPLVTLISQSDATNRVTPFYPPNAQLNVQLVYFAPQLSLTTLSNLIPYYLCGGTILYTNPVPDNGGILNLNLLQMLIPATDDPRFVPSLTMSATPQMGGTQVVASATVTGGTPPYSYLWSGSHPDISSNTGPRIIYNPVIEAPPLNLSVTPQMGDGSVRVSFVDAAHLYQVESTTDLNLGNWVARNDIVGTNQTSTVTLSPTNGPSQFVRLRLLNQPIPLQETLGLDVVDANGVRLHLNRTIPVQAFPYYRGNLPLGPVISWGTESPYDHDLDAGDTDSWHKAMKNNPIFGFERFYRGVYVADRSDFFDAPSGNNDWIVDAADITYYAGHGNPNCFTFTDHSKGPGTPATAVMDSDATKFWGNNAQEWFCMLSCNVLQQFDDNARLAFERWGPCFDGLHEMLAFSTEAYAGGVTGPFGAGFEEEFVKYMAGTGRNPFPETIQKAWFDAAMTTGPYGGSNLGRTGDPAVLGPIASGGIWDINDYWWGMGPVGPRIRAPQIRGWYYLTQSN